MQHKRPPEMFKLSHRKGSNLWQVRKRWPSDVSVILKGEFNRSTGEADRKRAQAVLPVIAAEYERLVQQARDRLADSTQRDLTKPEMHRLAAKLYGDLIPLFELKRPVASFTQAELLQTERQHLAHNTAAMGRQEYGAVSQLVRGLIEREGLPVPEESPSRTEMERLAMLVRLEVHRQTIAKLEGQPLNGITDATLADIVTPSGEPKKTVADLLDAYEAAKRDGWSQSTKAAFAPVRRLLQDALGAREVASLTRDDARMVQGLVKRLPRNMAKQTALQGLTVPQAIDKAEQLGIAIVTAKTMNAGYLVHIAAVFAWAMHEGWTSTNMFLKLAVADKVEDRDRRDPFTTAQLNQLFGSEPWTAPATPDMAQPGRYWVPLLALFQGARRGELAGLRIMDVAEVDGIPSIHIRPSPIRPLKNAASRRTVPIHPAVLAAGFAAYVKHCKESAPAEALLFPDMAAKERGQVGYNLGVWFAAKVRAFEMEGTNLSFHSFRHNFEDALRRAGLHGMPLGLGLSGRDEGGSQANYGNGTTMADFLDALSKVSYPGVTLPEIKP